ncbi:unnamed protein product [Calicophoron daubneyi]|uniref:2-methoxy-6-polyprenyl-1,4-benzoquinol methylase, mitochondrial n=1 Tax=Calicophoron daubneyi TaxID=300641 RepID=A0AAV2TTG9_CALDB
MSLLFSIRSLRMLSPSVAPRFLNGHLRFGSTHFGFQEVDEEEKQNKVNHVFENVAEKYDLMNDAMSFGVHRLWKDCFVKQIMPTHNLKCLDVAGGTGDIAFRIHKFSRPSTTVLGSSGESHSDGRTGPDITLCDINEAMMEVGKARAQSLGLTNIKWVQGNAECLPFEDNVFDLYTIAFGIRNCTHIDKVLSEANRVLKPRGRFFCLEFSHVDNPIFSRLYDLYSMELIPVMGQLIAGDWNSYQYLVESIRQFPPQKEFAEMIREAGFFGVQVQNYLLGVAAVHSGFKSTTSQKTKVRNEDDEDEM